MAAASGTRLSERVAHWQTSKNSLTNRVAFLFENSLMSDVQFVVPECQAADGNENNSQARIPAHRLLLAIGSPVFDAMFYGDMADPSSEIRLPDTDANSLREFLRFLYCDEANLNFDNVLGVLYLAQKYIVPSLGELCGQFLKKETTEATVFQILEAAQKFNEQKLEEQCWDFIDANTSDCLKCESFVGVSFDTLTSLLRRETLFTKEIHLFDAARRWAETRCKERGLVQTGAVLRGILGSLLYLIRFPTMLLQDFEENVVPAGMLSLEESEEIRLYLSCACPSGVGAGFSCHMRAGAFSNSILRECMYVYHDVVCPDHEEFTSRTESLSFKTDKSIHLHGVRLFASKNHGEFFHAAVRLLHQNGFELAQQAGTFSVDGHKAFSFDVLFKLPILIRELRKYTVHVTVRGVGGAKVQRNLSRAVGTVKTVGVKFAFEGERAYQIMELFFYKLE